MQHKSLAVALTFSVAFAEEDDDEADDDEENDDQDDDDEDLDVEEEDQVRGRDPRPSKTRGLYDKMKRVRRRRTHVALLFLLVLWEGTAAGGSGSMNPSEPSRADQVSLRQRLVDLESKIRAVIGEARAERLEQCRAIGFGAKPCGGPWRYLVYSTAATDAGRLENLVAEYNALDRRRNGEEGLVSDCAVVGPPAPALVGGRCVGRGR